MKATGEREVLGLNVGPSEDEAFWLQFLRGLVGRGLKEGVTLAISDAHQGLKGAIEAVLQGRAQQCRVHFMRNTLALVPKTAASMVAATIRTVFVQPDPASAREQWQRVIDNLGPSFPRLAHLAFLQEHWLQIWSSNPLERVNREVKRRTHVAGIFPNTAPVVRLVGMVLAEQHDEWQVIRRYFSAKSLAKLKEAQEAAPLAALIASRGESLWVSGQLCGRAHLPTGPLLR